MRRLNSQFITRFLSEPGLDGQNGTYYGFVEMDQYYCMAVAEGYDGEGGRESAKLAVDTAIEAFIQKPGISAGRIRMCLKKAHRSLAETSVRIRLKAGILLIVSDYTRFRYGVCGNVMLYALRNAGIYHQSTTHTVYQSMVEENQGRDSGIAPAGETRNLYHYLGGSGAAAVSGKFRLEDGDVLLAVTESFWSRVNKVEILDAYESIQSEDEFLGDLQELYLRGSTESVPCCCLAAVSVQKAYRENTALRKKILFWCLIGGLILALIGAILFFAVRSRKKKQREIRNALEVYEDAGDQYMTRLNGVLAKQEYEKAAEEGKKLGKSEEKLSQEKLLSGKIDLSTLLESAGKEYESRNYTQARTEYKRILELLKSYPELSSLSGDIEKRLRLAGAGMEIDSYIQNAALKEAEGDLEAASVLYDRAEAMLRIVDDPDRLQEVQLAKLRVRGQAEEESKEARAKARDEVIIDADKTAAMDAVLAGDYELAVELYTKIRDSYIALEENEKAEQTTEILLSLQRQARADGAEEAERESDQQAALEAVLKGDRETAIELYKKVRDAYLAGEEEEKAKEIAEIIAALERQEQAGEDAQGEPQASGPGQAAAAGAPGSQPSGQGPGASQTLPGSGPSLGSDEAPGPEKSSFFEKIQTGPGGDSDG